MSGPIVITGGGTGGHIFPMLAIAEQLRARGVEPSRLRFAGSRRGQEATLLGGTSIALTLLPGRGIRRSLAPQALLENAGAVLGLASALTLAWSKMFRWKPSVVVSVGGYASFTVALAAVLWRRPLVLVDLDATPGLAHRVLRRFAVRRCTGFATDDPRSVFTGAPLRDAIVSLDRSIGARTAAREHQTPPVEPGRRVVVVMTGSLGASSVNAAVVELAREWASRSDRTVVHVTGRRDYARLEAARPETSGLDYRVIAFADMVELWSICDVAVCRAGATTVAELTALGIPSVLVPLPNAPGDHQTKNAVAVVEAGAGLMVADRDCTGAMLARSLDGIMNDETLRSMSLAATSIGHRDAAARIADVVLEVGGRR